MTARDKLQHLLITSLMKDGQVEFILPNGLKVELGLTKETKHGTQIGDECWMTASQEDRMVSLDANNMELQFSRNRLVFNDEDAENHMLAVI